MVLVGSRQAALESDGEVLQAETSHRTIFTIENIES